MGINVMWMGMMFCEVIVISSKEMSMRYFNLVDVVWFFWL